MQNSGSGITGTNKIIPSGGMNAVREMFIRHCSPVVMGCKPAALFTLKNHQLPFLPYFLSSGGMFLVIKGGLSCGDDERKALVFLYDKERLEKTVLDTRIRPVLVGMGYPDGYSLSVFLGHLRQRFKNCRCPDEVGLFLGYPLDDVQGFIKYRGNNYKFCGEWKVYADVERAKRCFHQYDLCRESMKRDLTR
ncbi:MAG: DUF3793 family protein [Treponema sp.]|nr:DUF3793 family protein [Treponema sp.]